MRGGGEQDDWWLDLEGFQRETHAWCLLLCLCVVCRPLFLRFLQQTAGWEEEEEEDAAVLRSPEPYSLLAARGSQEKRPRPAAMPVAVDLQQLATEREATPLAAHATPAAAAGQQQQGSRQAAPGLSPEMREQVGQPAGPSSHGGGGSEGDVCPVVGYS